MSSYFFHISLFLTTLNTNSDATGHGTQSPRCSTHRQSQVRRDSQTDDVQGRSPGCTGTQAPVGRAHCETTRQPLDHANNLLVALRSQATSWTTTIPMETRNGTSHWSKLAQHCQKSRRIQKAAEGSASNQWLNRIFKYQVTSENFL